ncbi:MAG: hypothetical protein ACRDWY_14155 [Actinomycetes bacterium]
MPEDLGRLRGPLTGLVRLPLALYSAGRGPDRGFDLGDEAERIEVYEIVLTEGSEGDVCSYLDLAELVRLWPRLWLPEHVRRAWAPRLGVASTREP